MNTAVAGNDHELETIGSLDAAAGGGGMGGFMLNDGEELIEDIWSMPFGDTFGSQSGAINSRVEIFPDCDNNDSEFTVLKLEKMIITRVIATVTALTNFCVGNRFR